LIVVDMPTAFVSGDEAVLEAAGLLAASLGPDAEEAYMTTADMLRAEGEARGLAEGEARGLAEGEARGLAKGLVRTLTVKFGPLPEDLAGKVHAASTSQVETWTDRAVTADTLDQVFSWPAS
jgi:hypothetical protein